MVLLMSMVARATEPPTSAVLSGVVRDSEGNALPYVTIFVEGTTRGTITDANGRYTLCTAEGDLRLTAQMLGYTSITHDVAARGSRTIDFELEAMATAIDAVVVEASGVETSSARHLTPWR